MPKDYQEAVLAYYHEQREHPDFPQLLWNPTTAKIKRLCLKIYDNRYTPEADDVFSMFFDVDKFGTDFRRLIIKADVGDFRPLLNHIKRETTKTEEKNIELLAWLIDFKIRPEFLYYKSLREEKEEEVVSSEGETNSEQIGDGDASGYTIVEEPVKEEEKPPVQVIVLPVPSLDPKVQTNGESSTINTFYGDNKVKETTPFKKTIIVGIACLIVAGGSTLLWKDYNIRIAKINDPNAKCMYWNEDHYARIACNETVDGVPVINVDEKKLANFKRIMIPDTLTKYALGKVWYTNVGKDYLFFTDRGTHPVDTVRALRPLSTFILTNHTSYYRYLLTRVIWSFGGIILIMLAGLSTKYFKRKSRVKSIDPKVNTESFASVGHLHQT